MNILDIILVVCFIAIVLIAVFKGFLHAAVELIGYLLTLPVAIWGANHCAAWAYDTFVHERAVQMVSEKLSAAASPSAMAQSLKEIIDGLPVSINSFLETLHIDLNQIINQIASTSPTNVAEKFVNDAIKPLATVLCTVVLFLVFFVLLLILVKIVAFLVGRFPLPSTLKKLNHLLGGVLGAAKALLLLLIVSAALQVAVDTAGDYLNNGFTNAVRGSAVVETVNQFNPVMDKLIK